MVYPYLIYCSLALVGAPKIYLDRLFVLQEKIIRLVAGRGFLDHAGPLFYRIKILKLYDIHMHLLALKGFRMSRDGLFIYPDHSHDTCGGRCPVSTFLRLSISSNSLSIGVPNAWNDLPHDIKMCTMLQGFKKALLEFLLEKYIDRGSDGYWWGMP